MDLSQSQPGPSQEPIFVRDNGKPCRVFVEATAVRERPKLIRKIIKNGGIVVNAAREADLVLAENNTKEALELLEAWGGDKLVLSARWVSLCLQESRFIGAEYGWGGLELNKQGLLEGIQGEDEDDSEPEDDEIHLKKHPTPTSSQRPKSAPAVRPRKSEAGPSRPRESNSSPSKRTHARQSSQGERVPERRHAPPPSKPLRIPASQTPSEDPLRLTSNRASPTDPAPSSLPPSSQRNLEQALFSTMFHNLIQLPPPQQPVANYFPPMGQPSLQNFAQFPTPIPPYTQFNPTQVQLLQLLQNPQLLSPQLRDILQQSTATLSPSQQQAFLPSSSDQGSPSRPTPDDVDTGMVSEADAPSVRSEENEVEQLTAPKKDKGKARAWNNDYGDGEIQRAIRSKPLRSKEAVFTHERGMFVDDYGMRKRFYIMVDLKNRKDLLKTVKKHHGIMVSEMEDADYIVLNNRSKQYQTTLGTLPAHKIALAPAWLEACDTEGRVAEMAPFVIDVNSGIGDLAQRKKVRPSARQSKEAVEYESEEADPEQRSEPPSTPVKALRRPQERQAESPRTGTASPPPPTNIVPFTQGRNSFTEEDHVWFFKYARFKLERNPDMSHNALLRAIGRRAPHHSVGSWDNTLRTKWSDEMTALREDLASQQKARTALPTPPATSTSSSATYPSPQPPPPPPSSTKTPRNTLGKLMYPDSSSPSQNKPDQRLPPSSPPVLSSSTQVSPTQTAVSLKRKETSADIQGGTVIVDQQVKKVKVSHDSIIDVDSYSDV